MAPPPAGDTNVIRRSIYQNANTLVELLIKSKEPRGRSATAGSEPAWPAAVPVRRDGRPLSATARRDGRALSATAQLPPRPRTGRQLPTLQPAAPQPGEGRGASPERPPAARGRGGQRPGRGRAVGGRGQPPQRRGQGPALGRTVAVREAGEMEGEVAERGREEEFRAWTEKIGQLVQDIRKRPATAHLRPLLTRLEETVRLPPAPPAGTEDDPLRARLEEIQAENEELQRKFQTLSAAVRDYQEEQRRRAGSGDRPGGDEPPGDRLEPGTQQPELRRPLADDGPPELRRQLAKYRKYAKEMKKTKENLLNTIQTMEESHTSELKTLKEEHDTQMAQLLAQFSSETEMLVSFRADAEAVQRSLAQRVRENAELQRTLAERDAEVERLAKLNQSLHELNVKQLQQLAASEVPSLSELMTKLQSPSAATPAPPGGGDAPPARPAPRDVSLMSLDVTEPLPARPFPGGWGDVSLGSVAGVGEGGERRGEVDVSLGRMPPSDGASNAGSQGRGAGSVDGLTQPQQQQPSQQQQQQQPYRGVSIGSTNRRLFGAEDARPEGGGGGGGDQRPVNEARGGQRPGDGGLGSQRPGDGGRSGQRPGGAVLAPNGGGQRSDRAPDRSGQGNQRQGAVGDGGQDGGGGGDQAPTSHPPPPAPVPAPAPSLPPSTGGAGDSRPAPVGSHCSEEGFQRSLARLNERLSDLQQGISRAAQGQQLTP